MAEKASIKSPLSLLQDNIILAEDLISRAAKISYIHGVDKLQRNCQAELKFLNKV
jgi:hypothetical protein